MTDLTKYNKFWVKSQKKYERLNTKLLINHFKKQVNNIPLEVLSLSNYNTLVDGAINQQDLYNTYFELYQKTGLEHGKKVGIIFNKDIKSFNLNSFTNAFNDGLFRWILQNVGNRIVSVNSTFKKYIKALILKGYEDGKTTEQIAASIKKLVNSRNFYKWQALRIARTETSTAANRATSLVPKSSNIQYKKVWLSGQDNRVRTLNDGKFDHKAMHLKETTKDGYFDVNGELLEYPTALVTKDGNKSSAANIIQCRCTFALVPQRDSNGKIIRI